MFEGISGVVSGIAIAVLGMGAGFATLLQFLITRRDAKNDRLAAIEERLDTMAKSQQENERNMTRMQLLLMMSDYPQETQEILMIAEHYFTPPPGGSGGNWYATALFNNWLKEHDVAKPSWFHH